MIGTVLQPEHIKERNSVKKMNKKSLIAASIVGAVGAGIVGTGAMVSAESNTTSHDPMSSLVDKLSSTFHLDKAKVQEVFDQQRVEMGAKHEQEVNSRLDALVTAGTITSAQKSAIQTKLAELKKERDAHRDTMKSLSETERKAAMDSKRAELEKWASEQGLDLSKLDGVFRGPAGHGGLGGPGGPRP